METRLLDVVPEMGITRYHHFDPATGLTTIEEQQDVESILEVNKARFNEDDRRPGQEMRLVASIPMSLYMELDNKGIIRDPAAFKRWLNDRDNRFFRTSPERV